MYLMGDTHSLRTILEVISKNKLENCNVIHVGDAGIGFNEITREVKNLLLLDEALEELSIHLYICRGNHEYKIFWDKKLGLKLPTFNYLHLVEDYSLINIEGKNIFFVGGAISIDRSVRIEDNSYDYQEEFVLDTAKAREIASTNQIDIVVTHTAPAFCYPTKFNDLVDYYHNEEYKFTGGHLKTDLTIERNKVSDLYETLVRYGSVPTHYFYGHFHSSRVDKEASKYDTEFRCLNINELYEHK